MFFGIILVCLFILTIKGLFLVLGKQEKLKPEINEKPQRSLNLFLF